MTPGSNLLNQALGLIARQTVGYLRALGENVNALGYKIAEYAPRVELVGSFQPVPMRLYQIYGLDMQKNYANFYTPNNVRDIQRAQKGDLIEFNNIRWQCQSNTEWFPLDGWNGVLVVDIGAVPPVPPSFAANEWSVTIGQDGKINMTIDSWSGKVPDYVEAKINENEWFTVAPFPVQFPTSVILPDETDVVLIRAVLNGARSLSSEKVIMP